MDSVIIKFNKVCANDKARDIFNLAYYDTEDNRINFENEIKKAVEDDDYLLKAALRAQYIQVYRISTSMKPSSWARNILIDYGIITQFDR